MAVGVRSTSGYASLHETLIGILLHGWRPKRQTNGDMIMVSGQKPTLEKSIDKDRIVCYTYVMLTAPITINPENETPALAGIPTRVHPRFPGLTL